MLTVESFLHSKVDLWNQRLRFLFWHVVYFCCLGCFSIQRFLQCTKQWKMLLSCVFRHAKQLLRRCWNKRKCFLKLCISNWSLVTQKVSNRHAIPNLSYSQEAVKLFNDSVQLVTVVICCLAGTCCVELVHFPQQMRAREGVAMHNNSIGTASPAELKPLRTMCRFVH